MRLPKYRIWIKKEKKMYGEYCDGFVDYIRSCGESDIAGIDVQVIGETGECQNYSFDEVELMQYTGLKDKNGKETYEGDVVHIAYMIDINAQIHIYGEIIFRDGGFFSTDKDKHGDLHQIIPKRSEIIGNIYENPELLKEIK